MTGPDVHLFDIWERKSRMRESLLVLLVIDDDSRELLCCSTFEETNNSIKFRINGIYTGKRGLSLVPTCSIIKSDH